MTWIPNLKALAPVSLVANGMMLVGLGITFYYLIEGISSPLDKPQAAHFTDWPMFFSITIFAMEAIGVVIISVILKDPNSILSCIYIFKKY